MKLQRKVVIFFVLCFLFLSANSFSKTSLNQNSKTLHPVITDTPPRLDGFLDDKAWKTGLTINDIWITYDPNDGDKFPQKTTVYMAYDRDNLYFAFYCYDNQPNKIKTSITRRDNQWNDDWVGFSLDAIGNKQSAYDLFVNPSGVQGDIYRTANRQDSATDWVWYSAGKRVKDGYIVEIKVPLKNIRFKSGKDVEMGILFWRRISRLGVSGAWPEIVPGRGVFNSSAKLVYKKLDNQLKLEALPSLTYGSIWDRTNPERWSDADDSAYVGIGVKYGITSSITAGVTINPDFSQIESDAFQVIVNQRYPIFYSEKRPFFMEAGNIFNVAGTGGASNIYSSVHTRAIVDPVWGARLTGEVGKTSFGLLGARDEWPGREFENQEENPTLGRNAYFWIGRGKYSLGGENFFGLIYSSRELGDQYNRVIGGDLSIRFLKNHSLQANYLYTFSNNPQEEGHTDGGTFTALYGYYTKSLNIGLRFEQFDKDFEMDTGFYQRTGFNRIRALISPSFFPSIKKTPWFKRIAPYFLGSYIHDTITGMDDSVFQFGFDFNFTKQGYLGLSYSIEKEYWAGQGFNKKNFSASGQIQLTNWLYIHSCMVSGKGIYYDSENPFLGNTFIVHTQLRLQPSDYLTLLLENNYSYFNRATNGERIYDVNITRARLTYQFNKYLFIRGLVQYDSYRDVVLSDLLASFTLIPGTVVHLGYGSLHEKQEWKNNQWEKDIGLGKYYQNRQSLFFKISYLIQF